MKIFNINFGIPLKTLVKEIRNRKNEYSLNDFFVSIKEPSPQEEQFNKLLTVNTDGFIQQNQLLRLYSFSIFIKTVDESFENFEKHCLNLEKLISNFKKDNIKYLEIESINYFPSSNGRTLEKLFVINALVQAEQN